MDISIIVPCCNEEEALPLFYREFLRMTEEMASETFELILIDDGSEDGTLSIMKRLADGDKRIKFLAFSRNFGKEAAMYAGMERSSGDFVAIMDADLQDPPSLLPKMYRAVTEEGYDSAAARRVSRKGEPPIRSWFAGKFYRLMKVISKAEMADGARDYRMMNRRFVNAVLSMNEYNRFSKGIFGWVGFKTKWIEYENIERAAGETKWSFWKLLLYAVDGITAFSTIPLVISTIAGIVFSGVAFSATIFIVIRKLLFGDPVAGWASTSCIVLFLGGVQMFFIGILGQYLSKAYLEIKKRPVYICKESNFEGE